MTKQTNSRRLSSSGMATLCLALLALPGMTLAQEKKTTPKKAPTKVAKAEAKPTLFSLKLAGSYADLAESSFDVTSLLTGGGGSPKSFYTLLDNLKAATGKESYLLVDLSSAGLGLNMPQLRELNRTLTRVKASGIKTVAWLTNPTPVQYQVACMCDRILMADMGTMDLRAPAMETMFMRDVMDLVGIKPTAVRCGEFKGAVEPYLRSSMSKHLRQHYLEMLKSFNKDLVQRISKARNLPPTKVRELQGRRLFGAIEARNAGLIDRITSFESARKAFRKEVLAELPVKVISVKKKKVDLSNPFTLFTKLFARPRKQKLKKDTIIVLHMSGTIVDGEKDISGSIVSGPAAAVADRLAKDEKVKGVVIRINSPGGSATASEKILLAFRRLAKKKPVAISMGNMAASGGYYIACLPGKTIFAEPTTLTGSIGVFGLLMNMSTLAKRVGVNLETVSLDESAKWGNNLLENSDEFLKWLQNSVDRTYDKFLAHVTLARRIPRRNLLNLAGGRVWSGAQALDLGLVDTLGGLQDAIDQVAATAKLEKNKFSLKHLPAPRNPFSLLGDSLSLKSLVEGLPAPVQEVLRQRSDLFMPALRLIIEGCKQEARPKIWALAPTGISIK